MLILLPEGISNKDSLSERISSRIHSCQVESQSCLSLSQNFQHFHIMSAWNIFSKFVIQCCLNMDPARRFQPE